MRKVLLLLVLLCLPVSVRAEWAYLSVGELVQGSDLIVVGTMRDLWEHRANKVDYGQGRIVVREVIWGNVSVGDLLTLKWSNPSGLACPRVEHRQSADKEGIWLLTRDGETVKADYPGRFVELSERRKVEAALKGSPVVLRTTSYLVEPGKPLTFEVVYRNTSNRPRSFPGLMFGGGKLNLTHGSQFEAMFMDDQINSRLKFAEGAVSHSRNLPAILVEPRSEHRVEVVLNGLIKKEPKEGEYYSARLTLPGHSTTNDALFYIGKPDFSKPRPEAEPQPTTAPSCVFVFEGHERRGLSPLVRAELMALGALVFFPLFYRLRMNLADARLVRVLHGA